MVTIVTFSNPKEVLIIFLMNLLHLKFYLVVIMLCNNQEVVVEIFQEVLTLIWILNWLWLLEFRLKKKRLDKRRKRKSKNRKLKKEVMLKKRNLKRRKSLNKMKKMKIKWKLRKHLIMVMMMKMKMKRNFFDKLLQCHLKKM